MAQPLKRVSLNEGGTLSVPRDILRALDLYGQKAGLFFFLEGCRIVIVLEDDLGAYLSRRKRGK